MERFQDKVALVTGAGSGIELATARRLAFEGAVVVAGILGETQGPAVVGLDAQILDVREEADWDRALDHVETAHEGLDGLGATEDSTRRDRAAVCAAGSAPE